MQLNSKKELRRQRIERALKGNLKKRKLFLQKILKEKKKLIVYLSIRDKLHQGVKGSTAEG